MKTTARELSKNEVEFDNLNSTVAATTNEILITGSLQRIADALEKQNSYIVSIGTSIVILLGTLIGALISLS